MPSSVVDACPGSTRNAVASKAPCAVILISAVLPALERLVKEVLVDDEKVEAVPDFCYLGDMLSADRGCSHALQIGLGKVLPTTPSPHQSATFDQRSSVFNLCTATCSRNMGKDWLHFVACSAMTVQ